MGDPIKTLTIKGFKSIRSLEGFALRNLNILIGANGSGKSNFVSFFSLLRAIVRQEMQLLIAKRGGADAHLYLGPKETKEIVGKVYFGQNGYEFSLEPTSDDRLIFAKETAYYNGSYGETRRPFGAGHTEAKLTERKDDRGMVHEHGVPFYVYNAVSRWMVYHFHDTSERAAMRRKGTTRHHEELQPDAGNLAAFLLRLREQKKATYTLICDTIRLVAPFFDDFKLRPEPNGGGDTEVLLEWKQKGSSYPFHPSQLSDGTLRFICLATALLQPHPPATILIDEPELGLHPSALGVLAGLLKQAASRTQVVVSTQSAPLLDDFAPEEIVVVRRDKGESKFERLDAKNLSEWLDDYSMGEIWQKNVVDGGPAHE
ncbi:MAG: AAA family ATPase [Planctomycetota bacterium]